MLLSYKAYIYEEEKVQMISSWRLPSVSKHTLLVMSSSFYVHSTLNLNIFLLSPAKL